MTEPELRESWFEKQPPSERSSSVLPPPPPPERGKRFALGLLVGAVASAGGLEIARLVAQRLGASPDPLEITSKVAGGASWAGFAVAALAGAPFGGLLAIVMMHGSRFVTRAIFASAVSAAVWFCVHLFVFVARHAEPPPLLPMLAGAGVYGICLAMLPRAKS